MDPELRDTLEVIMRTSAEARDASRESLDVCVKLDARTRRLERTVYGSHPPPPDEDEIEIYATTGERLTPPRPLPVIKRVESSEKTAAELLAADEVLRTRVAHVEELTRRQCKAMGVPQDEEPSTVEHIAVFARSRAGRELFLSLIVLLLTALGYRAATGAHDAAERAAEGARAPAALPAPAASK